jgi:hypothetical protein
VERGYPARLYLSPFTPCPLYHSPFCLPPARRCMQPILLAVSSVTGFTSRHGACTALGHSVRSQSDSPSLLPHLSRLQFLFNFLYLVFPYFTLNQVNNQLHGAKPFLRSCHLCSHSRISNMSQEPKVHYRVHKSPPLVPIGLQTNRPAPSHPIPQTSISILSTTYV